MPIFSSGGSGYREVKYLYVDGAYLDKVVEKVSSEYFGGHPIDIDFKKLADSFKRVFYYHSLPGKRKSESQDQYEKRKGDKQLHFDKIAKVPGCHIREGVIRRESDRNRQKKVDVLLAVDMLSHTIRNNMDSATLLAGDLDFQPLIDALVQAGMYTYLWYEPSSTSDDLVSSADASQPIRVDQVCRWASDTFQAIHPAPQAHSTSSRDAIKSARLIKAGTTVEGDKIELYENDGNFLITFPDHGNQGYNLYIKHSDREFLEKYVKTTRVSFAWT